MKIPILEERTAQALEALLDEIPFLSIAEVERRPQPPDFTLRVETPAGIQTLLVLVKSSGQPRQARQAVAQLLRYLNDLPEAYGIFVAPYVSERAAAVCKEADIGYLDLGGNCRLVFDHVFIEKKGAPNQYSERREQRSLYTPKASRVLRVLLANPSRHWRMKNLAEEARVSLGHVANVKQLLLDREWLRDDQEGLYLTEPAALLSQWAENYRPRRSLVHDFYSFDTPGQIEPRIDEVCRRAGVRYTLTAFSGAERLAPFVRYQRATAYVEENLEEIALELSLKPVSSGANVQLIEPYDEGIFYGALCKDDLWVASPVQLYLDLSITKGRGDEAAAFLYRERIQPEWQQPA